MKPPTEEEKQLLIKTWSEKNGLKESNTRKVGMSFLTGNNTGYPFLEEFLDHPSYWNKNGKPFAVVGQPYQINEEDMKLACRICEEHSLSFYISTWPAWHYPDHVLFIEFRRKGTWS